MQTMQELVSELISNAYENGYEAEIKGMTNEELAWDILDSIDDENITFDEVLMAVIDFWGEDND